MGDGVLGRDLSSKNTRQAHNFGKTYGRSKISNTLFSLLVTTSQTKYSFNSLTETETNVYESIIFDLSFIRKIWALDKINVFYLQIDWYITLLLLFMCNQHDISQVMIFILMINKLMGLVTRMNIPIRDFSKSISTNRFSVTYVFFKQIPIAWAILNGKLVFVIKKYMRTCCCYGVAMNRFLLQIQN